jgi:hypothetical protein
MPVFVVQGKIPCSVPSALHFNPNALGIDGPVISASRIAVKKPRLFIETAKSDVISDLPTPPLPLTTPITFLIFESSCGFSKRLFGSREEQF